MHIPDGFLGPKMSQGLLGAAASVLGYCFGKVMQAVTAVVPQQVIATAGNTIGNIQIGGRRVLTKLGEAKLAKMGLVASWIFAAQMFNFPIGGGTSGHLIGGLFASVLLGPFAGTIVISVVLIIQSLFFADGGLMALGANIINMAVIGSLGGYYIYAGLKKSLTDTSSIAISAWCSVVLAALACSLEIGFSGTIPLQSVTSTMLKTHCLIGFVEAIITIVLLRVYANKSVSDEI